MPTQKILILAGGTGGHIIPALAVADYLRARNVEVVWLGTQKGLEHTMVPAAGIKLCYISIQGVRGKGITSLLLAPFRILKATWQAMKVIREEKPSAVVGFGGFVSGPGGVAAWLLRKPFIIHEQNAVAGMTNQLLARLAKQVFQAFPNTFSPSVDAVTVGNPVRAEIIELSPPEERFQARSAQTRLNVLVIGGSLGAKVFNETMPEVFALLPEDKLPNIWHSAGKNDVDAVKARYVGTNSIPIGFQGAGKARVKSSRGAYTQYVSSETSAQHSQNLKGDGYEANVMSFIEDMAAAYAWADLVVCRAGALTVSELAAAGVASLLIPYPYAVDDHQTKNAMWLVNAGAARLMQQTEFNVANVSVVLLSLLDDKAQLLEMAKAARALALPEATKIVTEAVVS